MDKALHRLSSFINYEKGFSKYEKKNYDPRRISTLLGEMEADLSLVKFYHVAGSNGKGSTASSLSRLIRFSTGEKTGLYTSPHLFSVTERISIDGTPISEKELIALIDEYFEWMTAQNLTYFEVLTFLAVVYFQRSGCRHIVLETGLGGRLDSTNFCDPQFSVITPISLEHTALLGSTLSEIAFEKAGIIKNKRCVFSGFQKRETMRVLKKSAREKSSSLFRLKRRYFKITRRNQNGLGMDFRYQNHHFKNLSIPSLSDFAAENFSLALLSLLESGFEIDKTQAKKAANFSLPFRYEIRENSLIDTAHNPAGISALFESVKKYLPEKIGKIHLFIGVLADKDLDGISRAVLQYESIFSKIFVCNFSPPALKRGAGSKMLFEKIKFLEKAKYLEHASLSSSEFALFCGSFYFLSDVFQEGA